MPKYVLVTGGVVSGIGKGILASSAGLLLKARGYSVTMIKVDPYLNVDAGTISPLDHGEVFVLEDGGEADMDLGNYERFLNINLTRDHNMTMGKIYSGVIAEERAGGYLGSTVQVVPHITDMIQCWIERVSNVPVDGEAVPDICIVELGGTVGDVELGAILEAMRQLQFRVGCNNFAIIHASLVPTVLSDSEQKTKPIQTSIIGLRRTGLIADFIACRSFRPLAPGIKEKISLFCNVETDCIFEVPNCNTYDAPLMLEEQRFASMLLRRLGLPQTSGNSNSDLLERWSKFSATFSGLVPSVQVAIVGKYAPASDSYISLVKALDHASVFCSIKPTIVFVESLDLEEGSPSEVSTAAWNKLRGSNGIIIAGGFGIKGTNGVLAACKYAREEDVPLIAICFGFQLALVEIARSICNMPDAHSTEIDASTKHPIVIYMPEIPKDHLGGTMRLGSRTSLIVKRTPLVDSIYGCCDKIHERHRHRYEVNPAYVEGLEMVGVSFVAKDETLTRMEVFQLESNRFFVGVQYHPELKSRPLCPSPLFTRFLSALS